MRSTESVTLSPATVTSDTGIPVAPWSGLSIVAVRPSSPPFT
jgi:hypothetical protein